VDFLAQAGPRISNLAGLKFTNPDLMSLQLCLHADGGAWDVPFGCDEFLLAALSLGATGAVGSTYNFAAPIYHRIMRAFAAGDLATARMEQFRSVQLVQLLAGVGFMGAAKAVMAMLGVDVGPARLPNGTPTPEQVTKLRSDLEQLGFFDWVK
jgi:N-acetylneuraminate lyase